MVPKTKRWEGSKIVHLLKKIFFWCLVSFHIYFSMTSPNSSLKGGILHMHINFPIGPRLSLVQKGGGGGHVPEMIPLDPTMTVV